MTGALVGANKKTRILSELISLGLVSTVPEFWRQTNQKLWLVLQRIPTYPGKSVSTNTLRIRISPEPEKYALDSVFQNLRISSYQWKRKAEFDKFFSIFANIWVSGNGVLGTRQVVSHTLAHKWTIKILTSSYDSKNGVNYMCTLKN